MATSETSSDFTLINTHGFKKNEKVFFRTIYLFIDLFNNTFTVIQVKRVLPHWLAKPTIVSVDLKNLEVPIDSLPELDVALVKKLKNKGCTHFFPGNLY